MKMNTAAAPIEFKKKFATPTRKLLYYWPARNRLYVSNELRQKLAFEQKLPDGRIKTTWFAFQKIPSTCVLLGEF